MKSIRNECLNKPLMPEEDLKKKKEDHDKAVNKLILVSLLEKPLIYLFLDF